MYPSVRRIQKMKKTFPIKIKVTIVYFLLFHVEPVKEYKSEPILEERMLVES